MFRSLVRLLRLAVLAATVFCFSVPGAFAAKFFDNDFGDGFWTEPTNWDGTDVTDAIAEPDTLPAGEPADIFLHEANLALPNVGGIPTVTLDSGIQSITALRLGFENATDLGDIQLLVTGGTLNLSADSNIGHGAGSTGPENFTATLRIEGGSVVQTGGTGVDVKLSASGQAFRPSGVISISGGSFSTTGTITMGATSNVTQGGAAVLEIDGSGATLIQVGDLKLENADATAIFRPIIDAGGLTPLNATDEIQFEELQLDLQLSDVPPAGNIVLMRADRISNENQFVGIPDGADVSATFGLNLYTWTINYFDHSPSEGDPIDAVVLSNLRVSLIPEPASLILLGFGGLALVGLRRRS
jgi:hypothetical protein